LILSLLLKRQLMILSPTRTFLVLMFQSFASVTFSQSLGSLEVLSSSGGSFSKGNFQLDWTLGELETETFSSSESILTQGFHQSDVDLSVTQAEVHKASNITIFPNPVVDQILVVAVDPYIISESRSGLTAKLVNVYGEVIQTEDIKEQNHSISLAQHAPGIYFLVVNQNNRLLKTFKVIKI
jgi:hypothetical protein